MPDKREKTVGIIGGMGPDATVDLMQRIINLTDVEDDAGHIHCIVDNDPKIPSRIKAIISGDGESPGPYLEKMAQKLEAYGADFLAIACNTAHYYFDQIQKAVQIPVIHIIDEVKDELTAYHPDARRVGILASPAIKITGIYEKKLAPAGISLVFPDPEFEGTLFTIIKKIKTGCRDERLKDLYARVCRHLQTRGADIVIVACTELSALDAPVMLPAVDAAQILANKIVHLAKG